MKYTYFNKWALPILTIKNELHDNMQQSLVEESMKWGKDSKLDGNLLTDRKTGDRSGRMFKSGIYESSYQFFQEAEQHGGCPTLLNLRSWMSDAFRDVFYNYFVLEGNYPDSYVEDFTDKGITIDDIRVDLRESWLHITGDGGYHGTHHHPNHSWGLIYYVDVADSTINNGNNLFYSHATNIYQEFGNFWQHSDLFSPIPENGLMIAFPADTLHSANVYRTDKSNRIVIAGIVRVYCDKWDLSKEDEGTY